DHFDDHMVITIAITVLISFFYFHSTRAHLHLHSFPTRRSSDLDIDMIFHQAAYGGYMPEMAKYVHVNSLGTAQMLEAIREKSFRSEEHTSELQSRGHLVCRLLLEKKNTAHSFTCPSTTSVCK